MEGGSNHEIAKLERQRGREDPAAGLKTGLLKKALDSTAV
jgi:hypothetical protein